MVQDSGPDLQSGHLFVKVARHDTRTRQLEAPHFVATRLTATVYPHLVYGRFIWLE